MFGRTKLFLTGRVVKHVYKTVLCNTRTDVTPVFIKLVANSNNNMAQRSITSFFKVSPPKPGVKIEKEDLNAEIKVDDTLSNGNAKTSSKRPRLEDSGSEADSPKKSSPNDSDKKKKPKRQRIESSDSESEATSTPVEKAAMKVEKMDKPKTYASPKSKKKKPATAQSDAENKRTTPKNKKKSSTSNGDSKQRSPLKTIKRESSTDDEAKTELKETSISNEDSERVVIKETSISNEDSERVVIKKENSPVGKKESPKKKATNIKQTNDNSTKTVKVAGVDYNPAKAKYHPIEDACWCAGEQVPYLALAKTLGAIEATSARLKIIEILSNYLRSVIVLTPEDLLPSVYMCLNQLAPAYHSLELGIAETYLMKAIGQCTGRSLAQVKAAAAKAGDLGAVAEAARATQRTMFTPPPLMLRRVFAALRDIAHMTGQASVNKKINKIQSLYVACKNSEAKYLIRSLEGKLRIGLAEQSVLQALALACATTPPDPAGVKVLDASKGISPEKFKSVVDEHAMIIKTTYCECPNYERLVPVLLQHGVAALPAHCRLTPGVPLKPMLAHPTRSVSEVFDRFEKEQFTCEWKYDGERAQIHVPGDVTPDLANAAIFSRNQENNTTKYPDVLRRLPALLKESAVSCVLDCEAVAYDTAAKQILPFQVLSTRKRKDASEADIKVQVCVFVFDLLYLNGAPLVREPLARRRELLREHFNELEGSWQFATGRDCSSVEQVQHFLQESVRGGCEGLMVKALAGDAARYDIARRSHNWLKLKKDYLEGVGDTLDVVVIGAYQGRGKRAGAFGGFLLACYEPHSEALQSLCKIGTGFSDDDLGRLTDTLKQHVIDEPRNYYMFDPSHAADVWVESACVWEVRCADLSLSPAHRAAIGLVDPDKGISLRFPRFIRVREDKTPEQATSAQQIADMYLAQDQVKNSAAKRPDHDDFY